MARKEARINFLRECKRHSLVPNFIRNRVRIETLLHPGDHRIDRSQRNFGLQVLAAIIRKEFQERANLRRTAMEWRKSMLCYTKEEYLFTRNVKDRLVDCEKRDSSHRLDRKLGKLHETTDSQPTIAKRVTCIDTTVSEPERSLLERGPKFVPTRGKLKDRDLRAVESAIEKTTHLLRQRQTVSNEETKVDHSDEQEDHFPSILTDKKIRRLSIQTQRAKQPPKMDAESERQCVDLKAKIIQAYQQYQPSRRQGNITKEERSAMRTLKERDVVIKCSDKSKSLVVLDRETYIAKADTILTDTDNYELTEVTSDTLEKRMSDKLKTIKTLKNLPLGIYKGLLPKETKLPEFYGLPKIHKQNAPLRPVVAAFDGPLTPISMLLERILHQLLSFVPSHIENTAAAIRTLRKTFPGLRASDGVIIVTMDVVALYPSIPIEDGISAVVEMLRQHEEDIDTAGLSVEDIQSLLELTLHNNYFKFGDRAYRQKKGVAMGNHLAPPLAIVFMSKLEERMIRTSELKPESYDRYVDDCLMVWQHGEANLLKFIDHCNQQHPDIRFTWESTANKNPVSFMDLMISIGADQRLEYELYQKPSDSGVNLNFESCIPKHVKLSVATQQFRRAERLSSSLAAKTRSVEKIRNLLRKNSFPEKVINTALANIVERPRGTNRKATPAVTLRLPFCSDSLDKIVRKFVRKSKLPIRLVYSHAPSLKNRLVRSPLLPKSCAIHDKFLAEQEIKRRGKPRDDCISCQAGLKSSECDRRGGVYLLKCTICSEEYVGETQRTIRARLQEHHFNARNRCKETPWGEHMMQHPNERVNKKPIFTVELLANESDVIERKAREAIEIRDRTPSINRNRGWKLD